ncbi:MAG: anti-sigma factor [Gammaproteobacteria bacterium]|nr:anti-sigma factor [Gammaproteobacteria bacterium]
MGIKHLPSRRAYRLARDYALGTLHGPARRRFDALLVRDRRLAEEVERWRGRLSALSWLRPERRPPRPVLALGAFKRGLWNHLGFWRGLALAASLSAVAVSGWAWRQAQERPVYVAVLASQGGAGSWLVRAGTHTASLSLRPMTPQQAIDGDYELWLVPKSGLPLSLGLIAARDGEELSLEPAVWRQLGEARMLAVSQEPRGGSPTGQPTGPVSHSSKIYRL